MVACSYHYVKVLVEFMPTALLNPLKIQNTTPKAEALKAEAEG